MDREIDDVIMILNFYIELGANTETDSAEKTNSKDTRIRVNDKTATGGWW